MQITSFPTCRYERIAMVLRFSQMCMFDLTVCQEIFLLRLFSLLGPFLRLPHQIYYILHKTMKYIVFLAAEK